MSKGIERENGKVSAKFERVFEQIDALKLEVTELKVRNEISEQTMKEISAKVDAISAALNQIIGKDSVRASIYGVIGSIVSGTIVWLIQLIKGSN